MLIEKHINQLFGENSPDANEKTEGINFINLDKLFSHVRNDNLHPARTHKQATSNDLKKLVLSNVITPYSNLTQIEDAYYTNRRYSDKNSPGTSPKKCRVGQLEYTNGSHKAIINPGGKSQRRVMTSSTKSRGKQNIRLIFSRNKCKRPGEGSKEQNEHIKREISPDINQNKKEEIKSRENKTNTRNLNNRKNINNVNSSNNCTEILNRWNRFERVRKNDINKDRRMRGYDQPPPQTHEGPRNIRNNTHNTHNTHNINNINNRSGSPPREQEIRDNSEGVGHMRRVVSMEGYPHTQDISNISHPNTSFIDHIIDTNYKSIRVNYNALKRNVESKRRPKPLPPLTKDSIISSVINSMTNSPINSTSSNKHRLIHHNKRKKDLNPNIPMISFEETVNLSRALIGNNTPGGNIYMHTMPIHHEANQLDAGRLPNILSYMNMKRYKINKRKKSEAHRPLWRDVL